MKGDRGRERIPRAARAIPVDGAPRRRLAGRAAAVELDFAPVGDAQRGGRMVLLGLRPQHRVQTHATFKLLFKALIPSR